MTEPYRCPCDLCRALRYKQMQMDLNAAASKRTILEVYADAPLQYVPEDDSEGRKYTLFQTMLWAAPLCFVVLGLAYEGLKYALWLLLK
jgi:hypothetical protein